MNRLSSLSCPPTRSGDPLILFLIGCLLAAGLSACNGDPQPPDVKGEAQHMEAAPNKTHVRLNESQTSTLQVQTTPVIQGSVPLLLTLTGAVQAIPNQTFRIGTPVSGKIERITCNLEDRVQSGQTLISLYSNDIGQAQSDLLNTMLDLDATRLQAETDLQLAHSTAEREKRLYNEKVSARADMEAAQTNYKKVVRQLTSIAGKRRALIAISDKRLQLMGSPPGTATQVVQHKQLQPRVFLKTPRGGLVTARNANPGEWVDANTEILTIADLSKVWVVAQAFEKDLPSLKVGQIVNIKLDSFSNQTLRGKITAIGSEVHPETRTLDVRIEVNNPDLVLKPNLFARVQINVGSQSGLLIPKTAIQTFGDQKVVYAQRGPNDFMQMPVHIVTDTPNSAEAVVTGLSSTDRIVTQGAFALHGEWLKQQY